jgi:uncharacterized protein YhaN
MKKYYTNEEIIDFLEHFEVDDEDIFAVAATRLSAQQQHIDWMRSRLALAERVIGELYLMQREYEE